MNAKAIYFDHLNETKLVKNEWLIYELFGIKNYEVNKKHKIKAGIERIFLKEWQYTSIILKEWHTLRKKV